MRKILTATTKWEYYVANIVGIIALTIISVLFFNLSIEQNLINFQSFYFWFGVLMMVIIPFALISFLSSMKSVTVSQKGLVISYLFKNHKNNIEFSDVAEIKSKVPHRDTGTRSQSFRDTFTLILKDGRIFEFSSSQFDQYNKLKSVCYKNGGK